MHPQSLWTWPRGRQALTIRAHNLFQNVGKRNLFSQIGSIMMPKRTGYKISMTFLFAHIGDKMTKTGTADLMKNLFLKIIACVICHWFSPKMSALRLPFSQCSFYAPPPESGGVLCYTLRNFECPSVRPSVRPSVSAHHHSCIGNSSYSFRPILLKLYRCFKDGLKICILFFQNPEIIFYHFFPIFNLDIFRALILQICIWSMYLVSATPPTVFGESFWNFTGVLRMVWKYAYCFFRILKLFFITFFAFLT